MPLGDGGCTLVSPVHHKAKMKHFRLNLRILVTSKSIR